MAKSKKKKNKKKSADAVKLESLREQLGISVSSKDIEDFANEDELSHAISFMDIDEDDDDTIKKKKKDKAKTSLYPWDSIEDKEEREEWEAIAKTLKKDKDLQSAQSSLEEAIHSLKKANKKRARYRYDDIMSYQIPSILDGSDKEVDDDVEEEAA